MEDYIYITEDGKHLILDNTYLWRSRHGKMKKIAMSDAIVRYGQEAVDDVIERCVWRIPDKAL